MYPFFSGLCSLLKSVIGIFLPLWKIPSHYSFLSWLFSVSFPVCDARPGPSLTFSSFPIWSSLWSVTSTLWPSRLRLEGLFFPSLQFVCPSFCPALCPALCAHDPSPELSASVSRLFSSSSSINCTFTGASSLLRFSLSSIFLHNYFYCDSITMQVIHESVSILYFFSWPCFSFCLVTLP